MKLNMRFMAGNIIDDILYFSHLQFNGLFRMRLDTEEMTFIGSFDEVPESRASIHRKCLVYDRWLIFIPHNFNKVHFINADTLEQKTVTVAEDNGKVMIADAVIWKDSLYILPARKEQPVVIIHLNDLCVEYPKAFNDWIGTSVPDSPHKSGILATGAELFDDCIFLGLYYQNTIIKYDLKSESGSLVDTGIENIMGVFAGNSCLWVTDAENGLIERLPDHEKNIEDDRKKTYRRVLSSGEYVYAIPGKAGRIKLMEGVGSSKEMEYPDEYKDIESLNVNSKFFGYAIYKGYIYLFPYSHDNILVIHEGGLNVLHTEYEVDTKDPASEQFVKLLNMRGNHLLSINGTIRESSTFPLEAYVEWIRSV